MQDSFPFLTSDELKLLRGVASQAVARYNEMDWQLTKDTLDPTTNEMDWQLTNDTLDPTTTAGDFSFTQNPTNEKEDHEINLDDADPEDEDSGAEIEEVLEDFSFEAAMPGDPLNPFSAEEIHQLEMILQPLQNDESLSPSMYLIFFHALLLTRLRAVIANHQNYTPPLLSH